MKKWILRIITAIMVVCIIFGTVIIGKGYSMFQAALKEVQS